MNIAFYGLTPQQIKWFRAKASKLPLKFYQGSLNAHNLPQVSTTVLSVHTESKVNAGVLKQLPNLKLVITRTVGVDHIDLAACHRHKVAVVNCAGLNATAVAEFSFTLLLNYTRKLAEGLKLGKDLQFGQSHLTGTELAEKTLGVVGTGAIGSRVAQIGKGFGMRVVGYDTKKNPVLVKSGSFRYLGLKQVFQTADIISLHIPGTPLTEKLINRSLLNKLQPGAVIINTARGSIVDTKAILTALNSGRLAAYLTDVLDNEHYLRSKSKALSSKDKDTIKLQQKLAKHSKVFVTPHMAHDTLEAEAQIMAKTLDYLMKFKKGLKFPVVI